MDDLRRLEYLREPASPRRRSRSPSPATWSGCAAAIDDVDTRLAALIEERAQLAVAVQHTRTSTDHGHDVSRERALLEKACRAARAAC